MDRKSIALIVLCVAVLIFWEMVVIPKYTPPHPVATNTVSTAMNPGAMQTPGNIPTLTAGSPTTPANLLVRTNGPEEFLAVSNAEARYIFTTRGGGLKEVQLLKYPATVSSRRSKNKVTNEVATLNDSTLPAMFTIYGDDSLPGDADFKLSQTPDGGVHAERTFASGLTVTKDFQFTTNYLMTVSVRFENRSAQPLNLPAQT
jgi:YidC/Oxa1 family membrane protein insertase